MTTEIVKDVDFLTRPSEPFDFANPQRDPFELARELVETMVDHAGLGLSAIQIGIPLRVFCMRGQPQNHVLFNPRIVNLSDETATEAEGCLSFPNLVMKVKRPFQVRVRYQLPDGSTRTETWGGLTARVVQHEIDHMDAILFYKRANRFHRDQGFRQRDKIIRGLRKFG